MQAPLPMHARNWKWRAEVHTHDSGVFDLSGGVVAASVRKTLGDPTGVFNLVLKPSSSPGGRSVDLLSALRDDDWAMLGATDGNGSTWHITTALIDGVRRQRAGTAGATTYIVRGRDLGKVLIKTDLLDMPWLGPSVTKGAHIISAAQAKWAVDTLGPGATPGRVVDVLVRFVLRGGEFRGDSQFWAVPPSLQISTPRGQSPVDLSIRQASDVLSTEHVDMQTDGNLPTMLSLPMGIAGGGSLWSLLQQYGNPLINEIIVDEIPVLGSDSSTAFVVVDGGFTRTSPSIRLRQKPFPSIVTGQSDSWRSLPVSEFPEADLESYDVERTGAERFEWFAVDSASGPELMQTALSALLNGDTPPDRLWDAHPALLQTSMERHGLTRFQQGTPYLDPEAVESALLATKWAHLLRDWYAPNPVFLSGSATIAYLAPGIRVGERFRVLLRDGSVEEFYVEGVEHRFTKRDDGSAHGNTVLSLTRGWRLPDVDADYAAAVKRWLGDNLEVMV